MSIPEQRVYMSQMSKNIFMGVLGCRREKNKEAGAFCLEARIPRKNRMNFSGTIPSEIDEINVRQLAIINLSGR